MPMRQRNPPEKCDLAYAGVPANDPKIPRPVLNPKPRNRSMSRGGIGLEEFEDLAPDLLRANQRVVEATRRTLHEGIITWRALIELAKLPGDAETSDSS